MEQARDNNVVRKVMVDGDDVHVTLRDEIDVVTSPMLQRLLEQAASESTSGAVMLDMSVSRSSIRWPYGSWCTSTSACRREVVCDSA